MPISDLLTALALTWLIEWAVAAVIMRRSNLRLAFGVLLVNALTQPLASAAVHEFNYNLWLVEAVVFIVEVPLYRLMIGPSWAQAGLISLVGNSLSAGAGFFLL